MPKTPIDYAKTIIYKLVHKDDLNDENIYTGHTTDFICRKNKHKHVCNTPTNNQYNTKKYKYIRENGGWDEWLMIEIEKYPCKDKPEAIARERVIQAEMKAKLNSNIPGRTQEEYRHDNYDKRLEQNKQYYQDNRDKRLEHSKQYYQNNRDKMLERSKQYQINNPEKILEKMKERIICDVCGKDIAKYKKSIHQKTNSCINFKLN